MSTSFKSFWSEIKGAALRFSAFSKAHKSSAVLLVLALLFLYGPRLFYFDISIDSEIALSSQAGIMNSWLGINRFGLVVTKKLLGLTAFVPYASNFLMLLALGFSAFFFNFCVDEWAGHPANYKFFFCIFPIACISAPCFAEQFYFSLQSFEIALAGGMCFLSAYCASRPLLWRESPLWFLPGLALLVWALGSYQAFASLFIASALVSYLLAYKNSRLSMERGADWFFCGLKYIAFFSAGFLFYLAAAKFVRFYYGLNPDYIDSMVLWKTQGVPAALSNIKGDFNRIYRGDWPTFFPRAFPPAMLLCSFLLLVRGWRARRGGFLFYAAACILLALSPLYLTVIMGSCQPIRGQLVFPLVSVFYLAELTTLCANRSRISPGARSAGQRLTASALCIASLIAVLHQGHTMTRLFLTAHLAYEQDKTLASEICLRIGETEANSGRIGRPVVFVGKKGVRLPDDALPGDVIGHSFFEWDNSSSFGSTKRILGLCHTLGYDLPMPDEGQAAAAKQEAEAMPSWPASESVRNAGDFIVVKLSDEAEN